VSVPLKSDFLSIRDAPNADVEPAKYVHEKKVVKAGDKFAVHMAPGGGFVVKFTKK
jgi:hypothetical protein